MDNRSAGNDCIGSADLDCAISVSAVCYQYPPPKKICKTSIAQYPPAALGTAMFAGAQKRGGTWGSKKNCKTSIAQYPPAASARAMFVGVQKRGSMAQQKKAAKPSITQYQLQALTRAMFVPVRKFTTHGRGTGMFYLPIKKLHFTVMEK
ncbi:MAG: hypothetical protein IT211_04280 [Armatimonadetes bacterium]|nr:hypothetical protein [Armatimonadota bacterium]